MKNSFKWIVILLSLGILGGGFWQMASPPSQQTDELVIYLVRHGKTMLNTTERVQGWSDAILTPIGIEVVKELALGLKEKGLVFSSAYSSDSGRTQETAHLILEGIGYSGPSLKTDTRLRELNFGSYEGELDHILWQEIAQKQGKTVEEWRSTEFSLPDFANAIAEMDKGKFSKEANWPAEDYDTMVHRLKEGLDSVVENALRRGGGDILVVSHGLSIAALVNTLDPLKKTSAYLENASVTKILYRQGKYAVMEVGDMSFIQRGKELKRESSSL
jgi:probable phosphoglycerate mutase